MSEQKNVGFRNRKLWAGGAIAALVLGVAFFTFNYPPKGGDVAARSLQPNAIKRRRRGRGH